MLVLFSFTRWLRAGIFNGRCMEMHIVDGWKQWHAQNLAHHQGGTQKLGRHRNVALCNVTTAL